MQHEGSFKHNRYWSTLRPWFLVILGCNPLTLYLWWRWRGGGPSTWHDLFRDVLPALVRVSYCDLRRWKSKRKGRTWTEHLSTVDQCETTQLSFHCQPSGPIDKLNVTGIFEAKENVPHWEDKGFCPFNRFDLSREATSAPLLVVMTYRFAFPLRWALWLGWRLLRRRGLLRLLGRTDYDRRSLDTLSELRLGWIVRSSWKLKRKKTATSDCEPQNNQFIKFKQWPDGIKGHT